MLNLSVIGNLGSDPDVRYSTNGSPMLRANVAANFRTRAAEGEYVDKTEWIRVTVIGKRAEILSQYLRKGTKVYVSGRLEARPWTGNNGEIHAGLEMMANEVEFFSPREDTGGQRQPVATGNQPAQGTDDDDIDASLPF